MKRLLRRIFKYCPYCGRWFQWTIKLRRQSTEYKNEEDNYIVCCDDCFDEIEKHWEEQWNELNQERLNGVGIYKW